MDVLTAFAEVAAGDGVLAAVEVVLCHQPRSAGVVRLLDSMGVVWRVDPENPTEWCPRCAARRGMTVHTRAAPAWEPNWIDYRHSLMLADKRDEAGEKVEVCAGCGCETDQQGRVRGHVPHSPRCEFVQAELAEARRARGGARPEDELELEETPGAGPGVSSSPEPVEAEELSGSSDGAGRASAGDAAGAQGEEGPAVPAGGPRVDGRGARTWSRKKVGRPEAIAAFQAVCREVGHTPYSEEWKRMHRSPSWATLTRIFGTWEALCEAADVPLPDPKPKYGRKPSTTRKPAEGRTRATDTRRSSPPDEGRGSWIKVNGTGLVYRTAREALVAADEVEEDAHRVARQAEDDGNADRADVARDQARELAEKIRAAAYAADPDSLIAYLDESQSRERAESQAGPVVAADTPPRTTSPVSETGTLPDGGRDDQEPGMGARTPAPTDLAAASPATGSPLQRLLAELPRERLADALDEIDEMQRRLAAEHALIQSVL